MPKFYQTPKGTISTAEKRWKEDMKAEGFDPKEHKDRNTFEVPIKASELAEFLTFHNVNVVNPRASQPAPAIVASPAPPVPAAVPATTVPNDDLDETFEALPLARQLHFAALACENARAAIK